MKGIQILFLIFIIVLENWLVSANQLRNEVLEKLQASKNVCDKCSFQNCNNPDLFCDHGCLSFSGKWIYNIANNSKKKEKLKCI